MDIDWANLLVAAVNSDNEDTSSNCHTSATKALLLEAPRPLRQHAELALADFEQAGTALLGELRSDVVANQFSVSTAPRAESNLFVARMTVPGGPWPGHFGLEAIIFTAFNVTFPAWFPTIEPVLPPHFADVQVASNGFTRGQGAGIFPELLALKERLAKQSFGVVFLDRLTMLYVTRVLPVLVELGIESTEQDLREMRQLAFLAHEWGHLAGPVAYKETAFARRRRLIAIISELYADLAGLTMLLDFETPDAMSVAQILLLDRIAREAWLPRARSQVDSVVARQLLALLRGSGYADTTRQNVRFDLDRAAERLRRELEIVRDVYASCAHGDSEPARRYLASYGWRLEDTGYQIDLDDDLSGLLRAAAKKARSHKNSPGMRHPPLTDCTVVAHVPIGWPRRPGPSADRVRLFDEIFE